MPPMVQIRLGGGQLVSSQPGQFKKIISDQRALRYQEYESGELLFDEAQEQKTEAVTADGNRDVMTFDAD